MLLGVLFPHALAVLHCLACQTPMPLPSATLPPVIKRQGWWPNESDWLYVACPECRQVSAYIAPSIYHGQSLPHGDKTWLCISFRCAVENCNTPVQFHILTEAVETLRTESELRAKLASGHWRGNAPCGHPIATGSAQEIRFQWDWGRLRGYDPKHPEWKDT
jgi:hypothetical protein